MKRIVMILFVIMTVRFINVSANDVEFKIISGSVKNGAENAPISSVLSFEFNLRIDPEIKGVTINGSEDLIEKILLKEGKKLEIYLKETMKQETEYIVSLAGIKEIYESSTLASPTITFKTRGSAIIVSEIITADTYKVNIKNCSSEKKDITVIIAAKHEGKIKDIKVITQGIESGEEKEFPHTFTNIEGEYNIFGYAFLDIAEPVPVTSP